MSKDQPLIYHANLFLKTLKYCDWFKFFVYIYIVTLLELKLLFKTNFMKCFNQKPSDKTVRPKSNAFVILYLLLLSYSL